jgi:hypothetical protein
MPHRHTYYPRSQDQAELWHPTPSLPASDQHHALDDARECQYRRRWLAKHERDRLADLEVVPGDTYTRVIPAR